MGDTPGQSEARTLLFAALLLADELHERDRAAREDDGASPDAALSHGLNSLAERLEKLATQLEGAGDNA